MLFNFIANIISSNTISQQNNNCGGAGRKDIDDIPIKLAQVGEAIRLTKANLSTKTALIGFAGAPWTIITYMAEGGSSRDFAKARGWAWQYPKEMDLKKDLADTLKIIGYFAAEDIIKFAENNVGDHNIGGLFGKNSEEIDFQIFDDIKRATIELENRYKDIEY